MKKDNPVDGYEDWCDQYLDEQEIVRELRTLYREVGQLRARNEGDIHADSKDWPVVYTNNDFDSPEPSPPPQPQKIPQWMEELAQEKLKCYEEFLKKHRNKKGGKLR